MRQLTGQSRVLDQPPQADPRLDILFQLILLRRRRVPLRHYLRKGRAQCIGTIVFVALSAAQSNLEADWAVAGGGEIIRRCPVFLRDSIVGHGRRRKQAHDEHHDWIEIRRGVCQSCGKTITFLPLFSPPYTHYSLIARSEALQRYFIERCSWETAAPPLKDPNRAADPATLRRWFRSLDSSQPPFSFLRQMIPAIGAWLSQSKIVVHDSLPLRWHSVFAFLVRFWPLRL